MNATSVGLFLAVLGIVVGIGIAILQRKPKRVLFDVTTNRRIVAQTAYEATGDLNILYRGRKLVDPYLLVVRFSNGGKVEIRPEDWIEPLRVTLSGTEIVDSGIVGQSPDDLKVEVRERRLSEVVLSPTLLNAREWFDLQLLTDVSPSRLLVHSRVAGAKVEPGQSKSVLPRLQRLLSRLTRSRAGIVATFGTAAALAVLMGIYLGTSQTFGQVRVPDLVGKPVTEVLPELEKAGLHLGGQSYIPSSRPDGTVIDQHPGHGKWLSKGDAVSIVVAKG